MSELKIWVIDDDDIHQYVMKSTLEEFSSVKEVIGYLDPTEAMRELKSDSVELPDLILLDLNMPGMDGKEFLEELATFKDRLAFVPKVWVVSSSTLEQDKAFAKQHCCVSRYLSKPLDMDELEGLFSNPS